MRLLPVAAALAIAPALASAATGCRSDGCRERVAMRQCSNANPRACVERAILHRHLTGWQAAWMRRIPGCESHWRPGARNASGSSGLYQFLASTWAGTPYASRSILEAKWNALAAAWMVTQGRTGEWVCR